MDSRLPEIDADGEVGDLSTVDPALFKPFSEWPESLKTKLSGRGKQKAATKISTTVRYSPEVVAYFRSTGKGWQTRMDDALKEWMKSRSSRVD